MTRDTTSLSKHPRIKITQKQQELTTIDLETVVFLANQPTMAVNLVRFEDLVWVG